MSRFRIRPRASTIVFAAVLGGAAALPGTALSVPFFDASGAGKLQFDQLVLDLTPYADTSAEIIAESLISYVSSATFDGDATEDLDFDSIDDWETDLAAAASSFNTTTAELADAAAGANDHIVNALAQTDYDAQAYTYAVRQDVFEMRGDGILSFEIPYELELATEFDMPAGAIAYTLVSMQATAFPDPGSAFPGPFHYWTLDYFLLYGADDPQFLQFDDRLTLDVSFRDGDIIEFSMFAETYLGYSYDFDYADYPYLEDAIDGTLVSDGVADDNRPFGGGAVPVPAAVWFLGSGFAGLMGVARRRVGFQGQLT